MKLDNEEAEEQLYQKLTSFLNQWARNDLLPQLRERLKVAWAQPTTKASALSVESSAAAKPFIMHNTTEICRKIGFEDSRLRSVRWTDAWLRAIDSEDLATLAFDTSDSLKTEFQGKRSGFLAYWRSLRNRIGREMIDC